MKIRHNEFGVRGVSGPPCLFPFSTWPHWLSISLPFTTAQCFNCYYWWHWLSLACWDGKCPGLHPETSGNTLQLLTNPTSMHLLPWWIVAFKLWCRINLFSLKLLLVRHLVTRMRKESATGSTRVWQDFISVSFLQIRILLDAPLPSLPNLSHPVQGWRHREKSLYLIFSLELP